MKCPKIFLQADNLPDLTGKGFSQGLISTETIIGIRSDYISGLSYLELSQKYKVNTKAISSIILWKSYKSAGGPRSYHKKPLRGGAYLDLTRRNLSK